MVFNSLDFIFFFAAIVFLYYVVPFSLRWPLLLIGSYFFYMVWNSYYVILLLAITIVNYSFAIKIESSETSRIKWLSVCVAVNLGILFYYKWIPSSRLMSKTC